MKKHLNHILLLIIFTALSTGFLSSCVTDDDWGYYPDGGNAFYDSRLEGWWVLTQANGQNVTYYDTNYLEFLGSGRGYYYYYVNGREYSERMTYFCQESGSPSSRFQINLQYGNSQPTTMTYWFTDNNDSLWLQWLTASGTVTYLYRPYTGTPW